MEESGAYSPPQPAADGQPNFSNAASDPPTHLQPTNGQPPFSGAAPPHFAPATVAAHVDATPMQTNIPQRPLQGVEPTESWFERNQRNKPQKNSAGSATLLFVTGGMNIAWSCGLHQTPDSDVHIPICWYISAIVGASLSAFITNHITKKPIFLFSAILVVLGGILLVALPHQYGAIAAARYMNGFAVGMVFVPSLILIGEEVDIHDRGMVASVLETGSFTLGIFLQVTFVSTYNKFGANECHGIVVIIYGVITCGISYFLTIESPVYHLLRGDEHQAIDCLRRLQRPHVVTQETYRQLEEHKRYIEYNSRNSDLMLPALLKVCLYRSLISLSFSPPIILGFAAAIESYTGISYGKWQLYIFGLCLWVGSFIGAFLMDSIGRKKLMLISVFFGGIAAIGVGIVFNDSKTNIFNSSEMESVVYALFVLELFAGVFNSSSSPYLTEAFPLHRKSYYIAVSFVMQLIVALIICVWSYNAYDVISYFITFGILYVTAFLFGIVVLPETKILSLTEAQEKFRKVIYNCNE